MKTLLTFLAAALFLAGCNSKAPLTLQSPDGKLTSTLTLDENGALSYEVTLIANNETVTVLETSALGLIREDGSFTENMKLVSASEITAVSDSYTLSAGKKRSISYTANEAEFTFRNSDGKLMAIQFRLFNDGVAYRYKFPEDGEGTFTVVEEISSFNLPDEGVCWSQAYDTVTKYTPAYETYYERKMAIGTPAPAAKNGWSFPITFNTNNLWILLTEANLDGTYPAMHLQGECNNGIYTMRWPEAEECFGNFSNKGTFELPWASPWRVAIIGTSAATIIESTLITDLSDPSKIEDTSWIKPGRAAWSWWSDSDSPQLVKEQKRFTDLAVEMGWEYNLIDANWDNMKDGHVTDAINYANKMGIGTLLWYNSGGNHNEVEEAPRNRMWDPEIRAKEFETIAGWGVKGVKVDFFQSDKQEIINQYLGILKDAADNRVMVNFHGCTLPRGWNRTWPNMVTLESVPGGEVYKFGKAYPEVAPWHNTVLPFTRNAVGPMDYTPVMFTYHNNPHITTFAHELATSVAFESGIIHMADKVEAYLGLPEKAKQFLKDVPAAWDDVKFIDGYPGEFVILARKSGNKWFVAGLNGNNKAGNFNVTTSFLGEGSFKIDLILDGATDKAFGFEEKQFKAGESFEIPVLPYGGFAGVITAL